MASESGIPADLAATPRSERSEDELVGGQDVISNTTVTTEVINGQSKAQPGQLQKQSVTIVHRNSKGISHQIKDDGSIHLRPKVNRKANKIRTLVSFKARESHFDRHNKAVAKDPFRGFYTLFWISLMLFVLNTIYTSFASTGHLISLTFATLFSRDAVVLALSDGILVGSLFLCVPFVKVLQKGWCRYWPTLIWVQHTWQAALLGIVIKWAHYRDWPWVQSGFFVLHTLAMMMKMHSYMTVNGHMADNYHRMKRLEVMIEERVAEVEGETGDITEEAWQRAVAKASAADVKGRENVEKDDTVAVETKSAATDPTPKVNVALESSKHAADEKKGDDAAQDRLHPSSALAKQDDPQSESSWDSLPAQRGTNVLRQHAQPNVIDRRPSFNDRGRSHSKKPVIGRNNTSEKHAEQVIRDPHPLATHPDKLISNLAREVELTREDLMSNAISAVDSTNPDVYLETVTWPNNVSFTNFWDYLLVPTLVYDLSFPRLRTRRPLYLLEKGLATFGTFFVIYVITEHWIMPRQPDPSTPLLATFLDLAVPMMLNYLLIFYIMFECICQFFAEWTHFADRLFYEDWWNSTSMDVFSRRWNRPVHNFLLRHVYASSITAGISRGGAMFLTFLFSSLLHELVMAIVSGKIRGYLFASQMAQLPLIALSQVPFVKRNETVGNIIFWSGLLIGFPMLNIAYITY